MGFFPAFLSFGLYCRVQGLNTMDAAVGVAGRLHPCNEIVLPLQTSWNQQGGFIDPYGDDSHRICLVYWKS